MRISALIPWLYPSFFNLGNLAAFISTFTLFIRKHGYLGPRSESYSAGQHAVFIVVAVALLIFLAVRGGRGRDFATGFALGLITLAIFSMGACIEPWGDPIVYLKQTRAKQVRETVIATEEKKQNFAWRDSLLAAGIDRAEGARRLLVYRGCVRDFMKDHPGRIPRDLQDLNHRDGCDDVDRHWGRGRSGWIRRYHADSATQRFLIELHPDTSLKLAGPYFLLGNRGLVLEMPKLDTTAHVFTSPIPALRSLRGCVRAAGEYAAKAGVPDSAIASLAKLRLMILPGDPCREAGLSDFYQYPNDDNPLIDDPNAAQLRLPAKGKQVMLYSVQYVPSANDPWSEFELHARPRFFGYSGVRSYRMTADGALTVTHEDRPARSNDNAPFSCEVDPGTACPDEVFEAP